MADVPLTSQPVPDPDPDDVTEPEPAALRSDGPPAPLPLESAPTEQVGTNPSALEPGAVEPAVPEHGHDEVPEPEPGAASAPPRLAEPEPGAASAPADPAPADPAPPDSAPADPAPAEPAPCAPAEPAPAEPAPDNTAPADQVAATAGSGAGAGPIPEAALTALPNRRPPLPRVMAVANQKGGVGKTTTAVNLGAGLAELGYRVLVIDLDPQGNATTGLGVNARSLHASIYDVLMSEMPLDDCIEPTAVRNLFVAPATIDLAGAEIELVSTFSRELRLKRALNGVAADYDFVLIDCPPSLGLLTINGLAAATEVLVPIQCEYYALEGLGQLVRNIQLVQSNLNPTLELSTIVMTMYDARTKLAEQVVREVRSHFGPKVCRNIVPRTVRLSEAPSFGQPILAFDSTSRGSLAYRELAKEVSGGAARRAG